MANFTAFHSLLQKCLYPRILFTSRFMSRPRRNKQKTHKIIFHVWFLGILLIIIIFLFFLTLTGISTQSKSKRICPAFWNSAGIIGFLQSGHKHKKNVIAAAKCIITGDFKKISRNWVIPVPVWPSQPPEGLDCCPLAEHEDPTHTHT